MHGGINHRDLTATLAERVVKGAAKSGVAEGLTPSQLDVARTRSGLLHRTPRSQVIGHLWGE